MISISIQDFAETFIKNNKGQSKDLIINALNESTLSKEQGARCSCGRPIWAIGTAIVGWNGCFSCITGEADDSDDYEIEKVNF